MGSFKKYIGDLFVTLRLYVAGGACAVFFIVSFFVPSLYEIAKLVFGVLVILLIADYAFLFFTKKVPQAERYISDRLSNGDENKVSLQVKNPFSFPVKMNIIDELPFQFQERDFEMTRRFSGRQQHLLEYTLRPTERGAYEFGKILLFTRTGLGLLVRRFEINADETVRVYPSFLNLRNYQLLSNTSVQGNGNKRVRKIGQSMEFEQIKDYVSGDDIRTINWKATARKGMLMVNNYTDEKSQQVYCIIDKGRLMKMPFGGLTLLDYAINSVLALNNICLQKQDKVGLVSFSNKMGTVIAADRKPVQRENILEALYKEKTDFLESDFEMLYTQVRHKIKQRSLLILYTNFESLNGLKRQVNYLRSIARHHLLLVVFFENTELTRLSGADAYTVEDVYVKTIAEKLVFEKRLVVKELLKYGIMSVLSTPENLTVNSINKYLELKAKQAV
ncbi:DUF58 domain-containing protein [Ferruginibacter sp. HRS2-29]|uniref:DUF58 domain-containing protein n=1 Tax=Ferruginibacter sp. HRS2-29 TaxID=2487334 RepID=UPI0020CE4148|nr:DUF58 domain-containing protein [Ferruginibacter sp. HRS2-29]MCP9752490.1 DUF58 domain-containing protein [Ferruginibacter sp. HRS2-29]